MFGILIVIEFRNYLPDGKDANFFADCCESPPEHAVGHQTRAQYSARQKGGPSLERGSGGGEEQQQEGGPHKMAVVPPYSCCNAMSAQIKVSLRFAPARKKRSHWLLVLLGLFLKKESERKGKS